MLDNKSLTLPSINYDKNKISSNASNLIDLHCHLDGSITVEIAKKLAELQNITLPAKNDDELLKILSVPKNCQSLNDFLKCFDLPIKLLQTKEGISEAVRFVLENCKSQGLIYLELRFAPQNHCKNGLSQEEVILAALEGLKKSDLHANLILCLLRDSDNKKENLETINLAKKYLTEDGGVVALDLAGAEAIFKTSLFKEEFSLIKKLGIPFTIHAGEADGAESIKTAIEFGAKRIGHGVRAFESPKLLDFIIKNKITLEICPTSNYQTKVLEDMTKYPLADFIKKGVKFTINTDDMAICRTTLKNEFNFIEEKFDVSKDDEKKLLLNAADVAFCSKKYKNQMKSIIEETLFAS